MLIAHHTLQFEKRTGCAASVQAKGGVRGCPPKRALEKDSAVVSANSKRARSMSLHYYLTGLIPDHLIIAHMATQLMSMFKPAHATSGTVASRRRGWEDVELLVAKGAFDDQQIFTVLWDISDGAQILRATLGITEEDSGMTK